MTGAGRNSIASYVVRIYRRTTARDARPDTLAGLVEDVSDNQRHAFRNMAELWDILRASGTRRQPRKRKVPASSDHSVPKDGK